MKVPLLTLLLLAQSSLLAQEKTGDSALVKQLLNEDLGTRSFSFAEVIKSSSGQEVIPYTPADSSHAYCLRAVREATSTVIDKLNSSSSPAKGLSRINECSRHAEDLLCLELNKDTELTCEIPLNTKGKKQRSGYPDLLITHKSSGLKIYLDPKIFEKKSRASSFRTFYFEPRLRTMKVQHDALHILVGIAHDGNDGNWRFSDPELVDLSKLKVRLKAEFQASNRDIYRNALIIQSKEPSN